MSDGESTVTYPESTIFNSSAAQVAKRLNGIVLLLEHRFYGESKPNATTFVIKATSIRNVKYLTFFFFFCKT